MSTFMKAMDTRTPKNIGENGHLQQDWSNNIQDKICQLYFQLVRTKNQSDLESQWREILISFIGKELENFDMFKTVIKMLVNVRDVVDGKGEQSLSFMMLYVLSEYYPEIANFIFVKFISMDNTHCLGSFKDIKYFCNYIKSKSYTNGEDHPFINYILNICIDFLKYDESKYSEKQPISLFAKWFPRSKSKKFGWINKKFSKMYYSNIMSTAKSTQQVYSAKKKCETKLRQLLAKLNTYLDTTQIKMAGNDWMNIDFNKVTGPTLRIHKKAFQNKDNKGCVRSTDTDRIECSKNLTIHLQKAIQGKINLKAKRVDMYKLVKDALNATTNDDIDMVNEQWRDNSSINKELDHFIIPMSDTSSSMECDECIPMYNSIGFGIRVSEKTHPAFRHRIMTFNTNPKWFQLNENMTFQQKVKIMKGDKNWGGNTNFYKALELILDVCVENDVPPSDVEKMILAIFSDMQIGISQDSNFNMAIMMENIRLLYNEAGLKTKWRQPYRVPHILFWNLSKKKGFPNSVHEPNTSMISGYNPVLLNTFAEKGLQELKNTTPYKMLMNILNNNRYKMIDDCLTKYFN